MEEEIEVYFPDVVDTSKSREYYANLKIKTIIELSKIVEEDFDEKREKEVDEYFYSLLKPQVFWGHDGFTVQHNKSFESACAIIAQQTSRNPKEMITIEYFQILEELRNQSKKHGK